MTRPQLSSLLGVTKQTVSTAVVELEDRQLLEAVATQQNWTGRSAVRYGLHSRAGWVAGVDLGASQLRVAAARLDGTVVAERSVWNPSPTMLRSWPGQLELAAHALADLAAKQSESEGGLLGVGIAVPRPVAEVADLVTAQGGDDEDALLEALSPIAPAALWTENNVNCSALAQLRTPSVAASPMIMYLHVGVGVGAAIIAHGQVLRGARGRAGEIRTLSTGARGHRSDLETALGAEGLLTAAGHSTATPLLEAIDDLFAAAAMRDPAAIDAVEAEIHGLAVLIHDLCALIDPDLIIMAGVIGARHDVREAVGQSTRALGVEAPIAADPLRDSAAVTGAALVASQAVIAGLTNRPT